MTCPTDTVRTAVIAFTEDGTRRTRYTTGTDAEIARDVRICREDAPRLGIEIVDVVVIPASEIELARYTARAARRQAAGASEAA